MNLSVEKALKIRTDLQGGLKNLKVETFAMRRIFGSVPLIFQNANDCFDWKIRLAQKINVDPCSIFLIGSACTGISLNPSKNYKSFDSKSDIDVAVVSGYHFEVGWRALREIGSSLYKMTPAEKSAIDEHRLEYLYWGMIATDKILSYLPFGRDWILALTDLAKEPPVLNREIKIRLYRDSYSLTSYHHNNLRNL